MSWSLVSEKILNRPILQHGMRCDGSQAVIKGLSNLLRRYVIIFMFCEAFSLLDLLLLLSSGQVLFRRSPFKERAIPSKTGWIGYLEIWVIRSEHATRHILFLGMQSEILLRVMRHAEMRVELHFVIIYIIYLPRH